MTYPTKISWQFLLFASMVSSSFSAPLNPSSSTGSLVTTAGDCYDYNIPVTTKINAVNWLLPELSDNFAVAGFFADLIARDSSTAFHPVSAPQNTTSFANFSISATFCSPKINSGHDKTVLLASHGLGFDSRYWTSQANPSAYNFVDFALSRGYSTFVYDRIGTGKSTKVSGYGESQFSYQLAVLASLTSSLRQGNYTGTIGEPSKIVHVGHSYGSILSHALVAEDPTISDGVLLTGIAYNASTTDFAAFVEASRLNIANTVEPQKYPGLDSGYLEPADVLGLAAAFFHEGNYDKEILWYADEIAQPLSVIEFVTGSPLMLTKPIAYTGPASLPANLLCDCNGILQHPAQEIFANASAFEAAVHPGSGHGINFNYNATGAYGAMLDFAKKNGL
ncbi:uncharacterized protein LY89DRAFT_737415 [Mollisia scopiformis]|uniref:AB hydrolase-1 domain-containing protein n=1 Tax=Mollisia scopiformis TaxID=149040 RepID=A0A194WZR5_MOLSC|nr:uncharacterized protein LY89DRAFT_737415 [Mollisia scopiformis]KUJ13436.1 hypothetical protein LY89DRAFT_737415 [Mollisia scopiformis]